MEDITYIIILAVSMIGLLAGLILKKIERSIITEPLIALFAGIILAQLGYTSPNIYHWTGIVAKYTMVIAVTASALRVPYAFLRNFKWESVIILIAGMAGMWAMTALIIKFVLNFNWIYCFLLGAILTPTDPVISSAVISGSAARDTLPARIRQMISFESGANDGLAMMMVLLPLFIISLPERSLQQWAVQVVVLENLVGAVTGLMAGGFIGKMVHSAHEKKLMTSKSLFASALFMALFVMSLSELLGINAIITVFAAAIVYGFSINKGKELKQERVQDVLERIFVIPVFVLFGMILPIEKWIEAGWQYVILAIVILFLKRIPVFLALKPALGKFRKQSRDVLFMGWFGPIGVAAMFYAFHAEAKLTAFSDDIWPIVSFIIFTSVIIHGLTSYPMARLYSFLNGEEENDDTSYE